jgi:hypothetical protein
MAYFVFDLDETLGNMHSLFYFICDLKHNTFFKNADPERIKQPPEELVEPLGIAYKTFVDLIASRELSDSPLGFVRPGILEAMKRLKVMKESGKCKNVLIYSNNPVLSSLEFMRDVIHSAVGSDNLICDCIHWYHPDRKVEWIEPYDPGHALKTWAVLSKIMKEGPCQAPDSLSPKEVYFFDDQPHSDLLKVLGPHYFRMMAYPYRTPFDRLASLYKQSLDTAGITEDTDIVISFLDHVSYDCAEKEPVSLGDNIRALKSATGRTSTTEAPAVDASMIRVLQFLEGFQNGGKKTRRNKKYRQRNRRTRWQRQRL